MYDKDSREKYFKARPRILWIKTLKNWVGDYSHLTFIILMKKYWNRILLCTVLSHTKNVSLEK